MKCQLRARFNHVSAENERVFSQVTYNNGKGLCSTTIKRVYTADTECRGKHTTGNGVIKIKAVSLCEMCSHGNQARLCFEIRRGHTAYKWLEISMHALACIQTCTYAETCSIKCTIKSFSEKAAQL